MHLSHPTIPHLIRIRLINPQVLRHRRRINNQIQPGKTHHHLAMRLGPRMLQRQQLVLPDDVLAPEEVPAQAQRDSRVRAGKVPQLPLVGAPGEAAGEVVCHVGEVQHDGDGVDEDDGLDAVLQGRGVKHVGY